MTSHYNLLKQETVSGSGISWDLCKSAPRSRQIIMPAPHHSFLQAGCPFCCPTNGIKALKANNRCITNLLSDINDHLTLVTGAYRVTLPSDFNCSVSEFKKNNVNLATGTGAPAIFCEFQRTYFQFLSTFFNTFLDTGYNPLCVRLHSTVN